MRTERDWLDYSRRGAITISNIYDFSRNDLSYLRVVQRQFPGIDNVFYHGTLYYGVKIVAGTDNFSNLSIFTGGARGAGTVSFCADYGNWLLNVRTYGFHPQLYAYARNTASSIAARWNRQPPVIEMYGHSAGGVFNECLAHAFQRAGFRGSFRIISYGTPKPGVQPPYVSGFEVSRFRWMNTGDFGPWIPQYVSNLGIPIALSMAFLEPFQTRYTHPPGGHRLYPTGRFENSYDALDSDILRTTTAPGWLADTVNGELTPHSIATYVQRLTRAMDQNVTTISVPDEMPAPNRPRDIVLAPAPPAALPPPAERVQLWRTTPARSENLATGEIRAAAYRVAPMPQGKIAPALKFRAMRIGGSNAVVWMSVTVMVADTMGKAKTLAASGNRLLRSLGKTMDVDGNTLQSSLAAFLGQASQPDGGYSPPLNVI